MKMQNPADTEEILDRFITGYHEYLLGDPPKLCYVSRNLCEMLQYSAWELTGTGEDGYLALVYPSDRDKYRHFLNEIKDPGTYAAKYRLMRRDSGILWVADTVISRALPDGSVKAYSTLADMTDQREETENLSLITEEVPCGLLRFTCEKTPKITYVNRQMIEMMHVLQDGGDAADDVELYKSNIYLMIAPESRKRFAQVLQAVYSEGTPYAGEINVIKGDGARGRLFGWVMKCRTRDGREEFRSLCMDITKRYARKQDEQGRRYLSALSGIYDLIFEFNREDRTVRYLHGNLAEMGEYLEGVPMQLETATEKWLNHLVIEDDRARLRQFLRTHILEDVQPENRPAQISFHFKKGKNAEGEYQAVLLKAGAAISYFCCRETTPKEDTSALRRRNDSLPGEKEDMQELLRHITDGEKKYVMLYEADKRQIPSRTMEGHPVVRIHTFGYFDVFVNERPIMFRTEKAKELLAILVDRRGGYVTAEEAISLLWEDEPASPVVLSRYRKVALRLKNLLEEYGVPEIVESVNGKRRLATEQVDCDLYRYLSDPAGNASLFHGSYLANYSWGEVTLGELMADQ